MKSGVLNSPGDSAVVEENISNNGNCTGDDIGSDPSHGEAKTTTSGVEKVSIVDGLKSVELVGHGNKLVREKSSWGVAPSTPSRSQWLW